jgi:flagellar hook-basal body complex protein FliE
MTAPIGMPEPFSATLDARRIEGQQNPADTKAPNTVKFSDQLKNFVSEVNEYQKTSETKSEDFATGKSNDIHGTMIAVEQAEISLRLLANVRSRMIDMYREVMRMGS